MEIPEDDQISYMLQQSLIAAERANLRRGHIPRDHPRPQAVVNQFMRQRFSTQLAQAKKDGYVLRTTQVPSSYAPSVRMTDGLHSMALSQMELQKHHRGNKVTLRVMTPPDTVNAIMAVVEDEAGTAVLLQLYHQPKPPEVDPEDILRPNRVLIVKEPFFKAAGDGAYSIRVDHLSDVVWLQNTDPRIPSKWRDDRPKAETSAVIRGQGNVAVKNKQWGKAEKLYSDAVRVAKTPDEEHLAYLNRSLVQLRLGRPEKALADASETTKGGQPSEKGLFREARALYELGKFPESFEKWRMLTELYPQNEDAKVELRRAEKRVKEERTGEYDFAFMYKQAEATPPIIDCATYKGLVAVREAQGRDKGLFTTKSVKAGDLLLCEKAFAYCYANKDDLIGRKNMSLLVQLDTKKAKVGGQAQLLTQVVQKLYHSPQASEGFKALHHGDYKPVTVSHVDGLPVVDTFFVDRVISINSFGAPRANHGTYTFGRENTSDEEQTTCGVWLLASRINHDCLGNCRRSFIGDMQVVRACQDLPAGAELNFAYRNFSPRTTYEATQKVMHDWGFVCGCPWCIERKSTGRKTLSTRNKLLKDLDAALQGVVASPVSDASLVSKIWRLLGQAEKTYPAGQAAFRLELWDGYFTLGYKLISLDRPSDGIEAIVKGFEALGYDIVASPPRGSEKKLEIRRWGHVENACVVSFLHLHEAYKAIAPELCPKAKEYVKVIYSMCTGTDVTIGEVFPQLMLEPW
ncbi:hypothetical protein EKO27_g9144 [Xylaria grammica]|uniref:SET domain-containing protein n=1 Tax=Xylaria grammica TaxID=363999 RepID=A0A439CUU2_9PEZI|nr:hypothetical protein EKO27_g9144 [Xylaria grammica]